jgi:hypothetical protein
MSVNSVLILVGILKVRYVSKIPAQRTSYSGRGFPWFFSVPAGICQYSTSNMPTNASRHKFLLLLPTLLQFPVKMFQLPVCHTTAICYYRLRPLKTDSILLNMNALNSKNSRKSLIFVANNDGHTECCYLIMNSVSSLLHPWSLRYELKKFFFFCSFPAACSPIRNYNQL